MGREGLVSDQQVPYGYLNGHSHSHTWKGGADPLNSDDLAPYTPTLGDVLVATTVNGKVVFRPYGLSVPAATFRNVLGVSNGETKPTWKALFDAVAPTTIAEADVAGAGVSESSARRDHRHGAPATWAPTAHNILSASHGDTTAAAEADGALIAGISGKWQIFAKPASASVLTNDASNVAWDDGSWTTVTHNGSDFGSDVGTFTVAAGDLIAFSYRMYGSKTMHISFVINTASQTVTAANYLTIKIPNGKTATRLQHGYIKTMVNSVPLANAFVTSIASSTTLRIYVDLITAGGGAGGTWGPVPLTDNITLAGGITLEVS